MGFPPCKSTPCFPSNYNWPRGASKTQMKQGGPENSKARRRTARLFKKVLRCGQLCSARNRRKIFTDTSFALMVSGATTHHSMLCQLRLHSTGRVGPWKPKWNKKIYAVVFIVFLVCVCMVSRFHWVDCCHPFKKKNLHDTCHAVPSLPYPSFSLWQVQAPPSNRRSGGLRSWNFSTISAAPSTWTCPSWSCTVALSPWQWLAATLATGTQHIFWHWCFSHSNMKRKPILRSWSWTAKLSPKPDWWISTQTRLIQEKMRSKETSPSVTICSLLS